MSQSIRVWDLVVRFGHWTLAALFLTAYFTEGEPTWLHTSAGYGVLIVIAFLLVLLAALTGTAGSGMAYFGAEKGLGPVAAAAALMRGEQLRDDGRYAKVGSTRLEGGARGVRQCHAGAGTGAHRGRGGVQRTAPGEPRPGHDHGPQASP